MPTAVTASSFPTLAPAGRRVLLVDDDESVRMVLRRYLELRGWTVVVAAGGDEALAALDDAPGSVDAVMVDLNLPDGCGGALCRQIVARHPSLQGKFVMATGAPLAAVAALAREGVHCPVMSKPFDLLDFVHVLEGMSASA